ncbi:unnamed protein product [Sphagnum balticum]
MSSIKDPKGSLTRAAVDHAKAFLNNVRGVVFYAVPHVGSYKFATYVNNLLRSNDKHHARIMENVQPCQRDMEELSEEFENFLKEKKVNVFAFGEGKPMNARPCVSQEHMKRLSPEDSLSLFCVHAFGTSSSVPQRLEALAKSMAEECGGLPLAPKVIGAAMFGKKSDEREWKPLLQKLNESLMQLDANEWDEWDAESDEELDEKSDEEVFPQYKGDRSLHIGDTALFQAGNAPPFIGILRKVTVEKEDQVKLSVNWLYRPADVKLAKGAALEPAPNEIFYSFHEDDISAASLLHPCKVAFLRKGVELPTGVSSFVCRRVYDTASKCLWWLTDRDYTDVSKLYDVPVPDSTLCTTTR